MSNKTCLKEMSKKTYLRLFFSCILIYLLAFQCLFQGPELKHMLLWTLSQHNPFAYIGEGQLAFRKRKCRYTNCFVTADRRYVSDYTKFDVIVFQGQDLCNMTKSSLPNKRSPHQKYVFAMLGSADNFPMCTNRFDGFFNWTWTYRLDPVAKWGYIVIRDAEQKVIGPNAVMQWMKREDMKPVSEELKSKLKQKTKAAAWVVSNCQSHHHAREAFVGELQEELKNYDLTVDIYGDCGPLNCDIGIQDGCFELIEKDYYFYLSFENSFSEDYVTEKILHALRNYAIPVVYGGANYTRFMPDGIYLNAKDLGPEILAQKMNELINNLDQYTEYFRWRNHYSYYEPHESTETDDFCNFCSILNDKDMVKKTSILQEFRLWWDPPNRCLDIKLPYSITFK